MKAEIHVRKSYEKPCDFTIILGKNDSYFLDHKKDFGLSKNGHLPGKNGQSPVLLRKKRANYWTTKNVCPLFVGFCPLLQKAENAVIAGVLGLFCPLPTFFTINSIEKNLYIILRRKKVGFGHSK